MINDEISNRAANIEVHVAKATLKEILKQIKRLRAKAKEHGGLDNLIKNEGKEMKLKDMVKKGQLEEINVKDGELKELKKELNRCGVNFSILKRKKKLRNRFIKILRSLKRWLKIAFQRIKSKTSKRNKAYD